MSVWFLYLVRCADSSLYTGITTNVAERFAQHSRGGARAAKYLRGRGPLQLVFSVEVGDRSQASRLERQVKRLSRQQKERLLTEGLDVVTAVGGSGSAPNDGNSAISPSLAEA
jgi:putative endonuclease